jgi:hypothetical protein
MGCTTADEIPSTDVTGEAVPVSILLSVAANNGGHTRMSADNTQNNNNFRGIQDLWLVPFKKTFTESDKKIAAGDTPMSLIQDTGETIANDKEKAAKFFFQPNMMKMYVGTSAFLVYGKATNSGNKDSNGSLTASYDAAKDFTPANVTFSPDVIPAGADDGTKEGYIATYLTNIATAGNWYHDNDTKDLFYQFANINGSVAAPFAGSSTNILKHVNRTYKTVKGIADGDLKTAIMNAIKDNRYVTFDVDLDSITEMKGSATEGEKYDMTGYPATLPDGVAGMLWNGSKFVSQPGNNIGSYVYPAELYYYANSRIYTSTKSMENEYVTSATATAETPADTWGSFIAKYENKGTDELGTTVEADTRSIALIDSLNYGVACLEVKIRAKVPSESNVANAIYAFDDNYSYPSVVLKGAEADGKGTFPLTAILVGGQNKQGFDFTPKYPDETATDYSAGDDPEYIIYDKTIADAGVCLGKYIQGTTANYSPSLYTLTLQTKKDKSVKVVLEFENNTSSPFKCKSGIIYPGTKFYLMASVVNVETSDKEKDQQVLTKDHKSTVLLTISNLENAYNALPSLSSDKVRVFETVTAGISSWQTGSNASVELHNW